MFLDREFHYRWQWRLPATPLALWPLVSDTNLFNHDTGVPSVRVASGSDAKGVAQVRHLRLSRFGIPIEWEEEPFEWVRPHRFGVVRRYGRGPVAEMRVCAEMVEVEPGATRLNYEVWARPRSLLGLIAIPVQIGLLSARSFDRVFRRYGERAALPAAAPDQPIVSSAPAAQLASGADARLEAARARLAGNACSPQVIDRLIDLIRGADTITLARMRPYELARRWGVPRRAVLELFLYATRAGLLSFRWEIVCPLCRGPKHTTDTLRDLRKDVHCDSCNIDFTANFDRFVELTFRPSDAIRPIQVAEYCVGGPQVTPHIVVQQLLAPGELRTVEPVLEDGRHRLRTAALAGGRYLRASPAGRNEVALRAEPDGWTEAAEGNEAEISTRPILRLENATQREQIFIIERMAWTDDAATAAEVTALQCFRDLFASEVLRPSETISVGSMAVLFTDLRGSTRLYREIGDAPAFGRVRDHFDVLRDAIVPEGGAIVKTIGDAVMAVFPRAVGAVRAVLRAQDALATAPSGQEPLCLKAGIHYGLAVNLSERLDYFGSTVNLAARLGSLAATGGLVVSREVRDDPEVAALVEGGGIAEERLRAVVKGFEGERALWRLSREPRTGSLSGPPVR